jgi:hypothetical protein
MEHFAERLRLARTLGAATRSLARANEQAYGLKLMDLGDKLLELELEVFKLHREMLDLPPLPPATPQHPELPF